MRDGLKPGLEHTFRYTVGDAQTVHHLFPEARDFQAMPRVFATGYMVALLEWACIDAIMPFLDWPAEQSVGTHIDVSHLAATPPGLTVTVRARLDEINGKQLKFTVSAHDGVDTIAEGKHERFVIDAEKFNARLQKKIPV
jgi:fluoroacetyl-CoA thioesterase